MTNFDILNYYFTKITDAEEKTNFKHCATFLLGFCVGTYGGFRFKEVRFCLINRL